MQIKFNEILIQCFLGAVLDLFDPETVVKTGTITLQLVQKTSAKVDFETTQQKLQGLRLDLDSAPDGGSSGQSNGLQAMTGILLRLQALERVAKVVDEVSKVRIEYF